MPVRFATGPLNPLMNVVLLNDSKPQYTDRECIERVLRCPKKECQRLFIARYERSPANTTLFNLHSCVPTELSDYEFDPELRIISPDYCAIYNEAHKAEQLGYGLVCGPGYRKALEFLIKDYLSRLNAANDETKKEIETLALMKCIHKYVTDGRLKIAAERATWLGNDETHYVRKWEDKDLEDMKKLIQLAVYWVLSEHLTSNALVEMPEGKK
jgi:hypothetical protein